jgi:hypothetical protein
MLYSGTTLSAGAYGCRLLNLAYTGPIMRIRKSTDTGGASPADFYADLLGNLYTGANGTGSTLATWLGGANPLVTTWYDQTGNSNHATQTATTLQPVYNQTNKFVDFGTGTTGGQAGAYFTLPNGTNPFNNSPYTYIFKHGAYVNGNGVYISGGNSAAPAAKNYHFIRNNASSGYQDGWWNNDTLSTTGFASNSVSFTYDQVNVRIYKDGTIQVTNPITSRVQPNTNNVMGGIATNFSGYATYYLNTGLYYMYIAPTSFSDADRKILEATI